MKTNYYKPINNTITTSNAEVHCLSCKEQFNIVELTDLQTCSKCGGQLHINNTKSQNQVNITKEETK
jgi:rRNA maturation endonuclease Nob1